MNETSEIFLAMATIAPLAAFFVSFGGCFCKFIQTQRLLYKYVKSFKYDLSWPIDDRLTRRYRISERTFAFYLYGTSRTEDKRLEALRIGNLVNEFHLTILLTVSILALTVICVGALFLVPFVGNGSFSGKITGCAYLLTSLLLAKLLFSRFIKRRLSFYRKLLSFYGTPVAELCKNLLLRFFVIYAIVMSILVALVMVTRERGKSEANILISSGAALQGHPPLPPTSHLLPHVPVAERPLLQTGIPNADVVAADTIAKFAEARRGGNDGETFSELNQLMDELLDLPVIPADYGETMVALYGDKARDDITRDFAVQHIGLYAQALNRSGTYDPDSDDARLCRDAILEAAGETRTIIAAAAFRALADVSAFDPHIDGKRLDAILVSCVGDSSASPAARVMAVQLCGERGVTSAMPALKGILADPAAPAPLRRAAKWSLSRLTGDSP